MNVEDSYEGAVRRLQRLEMAGILPMDSAPADAVGQAQSESNADRVSELEELATLACEDNERLNGELEAAQRDLDEARVAIDGTRSELVQTQHQLVGAHREIEQLRAVVAAQQRVLVNAQQATAIAEQAYAQATQQAYTEAPQRAHADSELQAYVPAQQQAYPEVQQQTYAPTPQPAHAQPMTFDEAPSASPVAPSTFAVDDGLGDDFDYPLRSGRGALYFIVIAIAAVIVAALFITRPWEHRRPLPVAVEQPAPTQPSMVTAPPAATAPPAMKIAPTIPKAATTTIPQAGASPTIPKAASVSAHETRAAKPRAARKHVKHHTAAKKHGVAKNSESAPGNSDDPLGGTGL